MESIFVICISEKYGAAEFGFSLSWTGKFIFDVYGLSNGADWTVNHLYEFKSCEILQVRNHDSLKVINYDFFTPKFVNQSKL